MTVLNQYEKDGYLVKEYPNGSVVKSLITQAENDFNLEFTQPTIEEQILFETQYQTAVIEILSLGGM